MAEPREIEEALNNLPDYANPGDLDQYFELYKIMVASSESLVARRQGVNTFFLTINGLLVTGIGLFLRGGGHRDLLAGGIFVLSVLGIALGYSWRSLLVTYGQLNTGKFKIINAMEQKLSASIFLAEWKALDEGKVPSTYRSFTEREALVPIVFVAAYTIVAILSGLIGINAWIP
jgi:hypothetical protein